MTVSFKQFTTFLSAAEGEHSPEKLDEIWKSIFQRKKEGEEGELDDDTKDGIKKVDAAKKKTYGVKDMLDKKKADAEARKKELQKKRDDAWDRARENANRSPGATVSARSQHANDRRANLTWNESKEAYSSAAHGDWVDDAKGAGYTVKKVSGNLMDGDQTWHAFNEKNQKVGEFTEAEEGRGGWLTT